MSIFKSPVHCPYSHRSTVAGYNDPSSPKVVVDHPHNKSDKVTNSLPIAVMKEVHAVHVPPCLTSVPQPECDLRIKTKSSLHDPSILASPGVVVDIGPRPQ